MVSDEEIDADPEAFTCESCPVADALADLETDPDNAAAWRLFQQTVNRFTIDAHLVAETVRRATSGLDDAAYADLMARFAIVYEAVCPPPQRETTET